MRKGGDAMFGEVTLSLVEGEDRRILLVFVRDLSHRAEREREREQLYREQAAREEAEHMAGMVHGLQMLLDAALAHGRLEQIAGAAAAAPVRGAVGRGGHDFLTEEATGDLVLQRVHGRAAR